jgi:hypothetical protein
MIDKMSSEDRGIAFRISCQVALGMSVYVFDDQSDDDIEEEY